MTESDQQAIHGGHRPILRYCGEVGKSVAAAPWKACRLPAAPVVLLAGLLAGCVRDTDATRAALDEARSALRDRVSAEQPVCQGEDACVGLMKRATQWVASHPGLRGFEVRKDGSVLSVIRQENRRNYLRMELRPVSASMKTLYVDLECHATRYLLFPDVCGDAPDRLELDLFRATAKPMD